MNDPVIQVTARVVWVPRDDVDTDQIIPARYLTTTSRDGLGRYLFADWGEQTALGTSALGREILLAGRNFGCGSSREHAAWALRDFGFRAIIAPSFADIFRSNALKNGLVPVALASEHYQILVEELTRANDVAVTVDVQTLTVTVHEQVLPFSLPAFARRCLLEGVDELGYLLLAEAEIRDWERGHQAPIHTLTSTLPRTEAVS